METRQEELLLSLVDNYIQAAEPIGSKFLAYEEKIGWSEATIRNDLRLLEEAGFLSHPHTSSGRVPTEKGYRFYVDNLNLEKIKLSKKERDSLAAAFKTESDFESSKKNLAKELAGISKLTVLVAFTRDKIYYTGLANLFSQPEFAEPRLVADVSSMFDRCEECLEDFFDKVKLQPRYFIGSEHPFGDLLSVAAFKFSKNGLWVMLGPLRADYRHNWNLINAVKDILN